MWQISGLPCMHAIAVYMYKREFAHDHVHWYYSKQAWQLTYNGVINPIPNESRWPEVQSEIIEPPVKKAKVGRPKKKRSRAPDKPRAPNATFSKRCSKCNELGHNRLTCNPEEKGEGSTSSTKKASKKTASKFFSNASASTSSTAKLNECNTSKAPTTHMANVSSQIGSTAKP